MNFLKLNPNGTVTLCGRQKSCCPVVEKLKDGNYKITDDYGNSVIMTEEQAHLINDGLEVLNKGKEELLNE